MKINVDKKNDWHSSDTHQVQVGDHMTCDNALRVCGIQCRVLDHQLTRPKEESEMDEEEEEKKRKKKNRKWQKVR